MIERIESDERLCIAAQLKTINLVPRLREALRVSTGGSGKAYDVNFGKLQGQLDDISRDNVLKFSTPPFFTVIIRSLTILEEGRALVRFWL
jgi:hypothetical protein